MSYIVEQKIKGNIYLYKVENKWDKEKKKTFQKRTYIGPKFPNVSKSRKNLPNVVNKNLGNVILLKHIAENLGLPEIIQKSFPESYNEIMALVFYDIMERDPSYLFHFWLEENYLPDSKKLDSSAISNLYGQIGRDEVARLAFLEDWIGHIKPIDALFFDITSVSSYSTQISYIEWGYNRDGENLSQLNMGLAFCEEKRLPVCYFLYPGSIVDVSTLKNCKSHLNNFGLKEFLFILDRGFFSTANILEMNNGDDKIYFIQPLSFSFKKSKDLIKEHKREIKNTASSFLWNDEILGYVKSSVNIGNSDFEAHLYLNEKAEMDIRHGFLSMIFEIEKKMAEMEFQSIKDWKEYRNSNILEKYREFFKWDKSSKKAIRNLSKIDEHLSRSGFYVMATNKTDLQRDEVLSHYRNKDLVEKVFDIIKNEMDGKRLRTHNDHTTMGKIFLLFIASIIISEISTIMEKENIFKTYTVRELLYEMRKIKINHLAKDGKPIISEVSKKQRKIFEAFKLDHTNFYGY
jgi:transposase